MSIGYMTCHSDETNGGQLCLNAEGRKFVVYFDMVICLIHWGIFIDYIKQYSKGREGETRALVVRDGTCTESWKIFSQTVSSMFL